MQPVYNSLDVLPIWNYWKINQTGDVRYLIKQETYTKFLETDEDLKAIYSKMIEEIPKINLFLQYYFLNALKDAFNYQVHYLKKEKPEFLRRANASFHEYISQLDNTFSAYEFEGREYKSCKDYYNELKEKEGFENLILPRLRIFNYKAIKAKQQRQWDLIKEVVSLNEFLNQKVDMHKTSVSEYFKIVDLAKEKAKQNRKHGTKNKV